MADFKPGDIVYCGSEMLEILEEKDWEGDYRVKRLTDVDGYVFDIYLFERHVHHFSKQPTDFESKTFIDW